MEENNLNNNEELENQAEEKIELDAVEKAENTEEEVSEEIYDAEIYEEEAAPKDPRKPLIIVIAIMAAVILVLGGVLIWKATTKDTQSVQNNEKIVNLNEYYKYKKALNEAEEKENAKNEEANTNRYNNFGYANVSGKTLGDIYEQSGYEEAGINFINFLKLNNLPTDMTKDTYLEVAQYIMPLFSVGLDKETLAEEFDITSITTDLGETIDIDLNMPMGLVLDEMTVLNGCKFMGMDEDLDVLKEKYGFGDEVTEETKWKEIRAKIDEVDMQERIDEEKAAEQEETETQEDETEPEAEAEQAVEETAETAEQAE